ncbi:MAG: MFS transporter [Lentisphaerota bacterium]
MPTHQTQPMPTGQIALFLILISALVRLGVSMYLPALPRMGDALHLSTHQLTQTITIYLAVFAAASLLLGPFADAFGRQSLVRFGMVMFLLGSCLCGMSHSYAVLMAGRVLQAFGASAIPVASRAMVRDVYNDRQVIGVLGWMGVVTGLTPMLAPALGGFITQQFGWRANFYMLAGITLLVGMATPRLPSDTLAVDKRVGLSFPGIMKAYGQMLIAPAFVLVLLPMVFCFAVQGAYLVTSPFIFIHLLGWTPAQFGATSLILVTALVAGRLLCSLMIRRFNLFQVYLTGAMLTVAGALLFGILLVAPAYSGIVILSSAFVFCIGFGLLLPVGMKSVLSAFQHIAGTASAIYGAATLGATAAGSELMGAMMVRTMRDLYLLGTLTLLFSLLTLGSTLFCRKRLV